MTEITPGVLGHIRRADRELAARLYDQRIPLYVIERACLLAAMRSAWLGVLRQECIYIDTPFFLELHCAIYR
ncbi:MAG: hypothetical protein MUF51_07790 [Vicinamibacteria bacterium]|nr:hypothetical protein [Vicinamibacteria bacterium]